MKKSLVALALPVLLLLAACGAGPGSPGGDGKLQVAVSFYPLQYAAQQAGGDRVQVTNLTLPGVEAHDLELTPKQIATMSEADVVVYLKGFQPAVDAAVADAKPKRVIEVSQFAHLETHAADGEEHSADDGHDHGPLDPHFWLDPTRLASVTKAIADELGAVAPDAKSAFAKNAETASTSLTALDEEFKAGLATCQRREFIVAHAAFGYLAERYSLTQIAIAGLSPDEEPSPARIVAVQDLAKQHGVTTIFFETLTSPAVAKSIAGDLGLKTAVLDPVEGLTAESPGDDYPSVMRANLKALQSAGGCA